MGDFVMELWAFMKERKKFWLLPIILVLVLLGSSDRPDPRIGGCAVHLYPVLKMSAKVS